MAAAADVGGGGGVDGESRRGRAGRGLRGFGWGETEEEMEAWSRELLRWCLAGLVRDRGGQWSGGLDRAATVGAMVCPHDRTIERTRMVCPETYELQYYSRR